MSLIDRICPEAVAECLRMFLVHFSRKTGKKRKTEASGIEELEEEEFQFTIAKQPGEKAANLPKEQPQRQEEQ